MDELVKQFLFIFNDTESYLKDYLNSEKDFSTLINEASKKNDVVRQYIDELHHFRKLRNVIVHESRGGEFIASPFESTVKKFHEVYKEISDPPKVYPKYQVDVKVFDTNNKLHEVLEEVKNNKFSRFPIYDNNEFKGLLTTNGITNALANMFSLEDGGVILEDDMDIKQILPYEEYEQNYTFISRDSNMYEALDAFDSKENPIEALLITEKGKPTESLLGIVTVWDVMNFTESI